MRRLMRRKDFVERALLFSIVMLLVLAIAQHFRFLPR
jgi:hypothetical protein